MGASVDGVDLWNYYAHEDPACPAQGTGGQREGVDVC